MHQEGESYSDVIIRLAAMDEAASNRGRSLAAD
jgi:hypothetical protein